MSDNPLFINDDGRCVCAYHAGSYLRESLRKNGTHQKLYHTSLGTWELVPEDWAIDYEITCEQCSKS